jgi:hypothetical protein
MVSCGGRLFRSIGELLRGARGDETNGGPVAKTKSRARRPASVGKTSTAADSRGGNAAVVQLLCDAVQRRYAGSAYRRDDGSKVNCSRFGGRRPGSGVIELDDTIERRWEAFATNHPRIGIREMQAISPDFWTIR